MVDAYCATTSAVGANADAATGRGVVGAGSFVAFLTGAFATLAVRQESETITFNSGAEMLGTLGMQQGGSQYRCLIEAFQRVFGATIFFGTNTQLEAAPVFHQVRFNFMSGARIWYGRNFEQPNLPGECQNMIVLTPEFYQEVTSHPIPTDLQAAKALSCAAIRGSVCAVANVRHVTRG